MPINKGDWVIVRTADDRFVPRRAFTPVEIGHTFAVVFVVRPEAWTEAEEDPWLRSAWPATDVWRFELFYDRQSKNWGFHFGDPRIVGGGCDTQEEAAEHAAEALAFALEPGHLQEQEQADVSGGVNG